MRQRSPKGSVIAALLLSVLTLATADACSVPVFRYALERWPADNYRITVLHRGSLNDAQKALVERLNPESATGPKTANLLVRTVDVDEKSTDAEAVKSRDEIVERLKGKLPELLPAIVVEYPNSTDISPAWSGALNEANIKGLLDSPARRELARRLLKGQTAVWVFLESGKKQDDDAAFATVKMELALAGLNLKLPEIDEKDVSDGLVSIEPDQLKVDFSLLRISRTDPAETMFVELLLGSEGTGEESLRDPNLTDKPMVFPVFGRGRILYALIDKGINGETITTACKTMVGPCTCELKEKNPGIDLVMSIAWNDLVQSTIDIDKELPPLTGLASFAEADPAQQAGSKTQSPPEAAAAKADVAETPENSNAPAGIADKSALQPKDRISSTASSAETRTLVLLPLLMVAGVIIGLVAVATFFVVRRG